jgi:hypothetical protein
MAVHCPSRKLQVSQQKIPKRNSVYINREMLVVSRVDKVFTTWGTKLAVDKRAAAKPTLSIKVMVTPSGEDTMKEGLV